MSIKPLNDYVLVKLDEALTKTKSGIFIPDAAQEKPQTGVVKAVGTGTKDVDMKVKEGERIMFEKYSGKSIKVDEEEFFLVRMGDILAVVE